MNKSVTLGIDAEIRGSDADIWEIELSKQEFNNPQKSGVIRQDVESIAISEISSLVPLAKSKKLAALRKQSQAQQTVEKNPVQPDEIPSSGQNKEVSGLLKAAQKQINAKIDEIMASYPTGKKNKMFALRYGSPENIKQMTMKAIFTHLGLIKPKKISRLSKAWIILATIPNQGKPVLHDNLTG